MNNCPVCKRQITGEEPFLMFFSEKRNEPVYCCETCEKQMNTLTETQEPAELKKAINYFYTYIEEVDDPEVKDYLQQIIDSNAEIMGELSAKKEKQKPISERQKDYFADKAEADADSSAWISIMRFSAVACMILMLIAGIVLGCTFLGINGGVGQGFLIILITILVAPFSVSGIMVFLNMAEDLKYIRRRLSKK